MTPPAYSPPRWIWNWSSLLLLAAAACGPAPTINAFTASPPEVPAGDSVTLSWDLKEAGDVEISGVGKQPAGQTSVNVQPQQTTTYTLTAKNLGGTSTATVTVALVPRFKLAGGTYSGDKGLGLTVAALLRDAAGNPPSSDTPITLTAPDKATFPITCSGGRPLCLLSFPTTVPQSGTYLASATIGGATVQTSFTLETGSHLASPAPMTVQPEGTQTLRATWTPVPGATSYRVQAINLDPPGEGVGPAQVVTGTTAAVTTTQAMSATGHYGVAVEASLLDLNQAIAPSPLGTPLSAPNITRAVGRAGSRIDDWQMFEAAAWQGNTLSVPLGPLAATESIAVLLLNLGGKDNGSVTVSASGIGPAPLPVGLRGVPPNLAPTDFSSNAAIAPWAPDVLHTPPAFHMQLRREEAELIHHPRADPASPGTTRAGLNAPAPATTSFCVRKGDSSTFVRKTATLKRESTHALFYVDDQDLSQYTTQEPGVWDTLQTLWEDKIYPGDTGTFGAESDVDGNGKLIVFLSGELGAVTDSGILLGYFTGNDNYNALDTSAKCSGTSAAQFGNKGSNHADMFYLNSPANVVGAGAQATDLISRIYPDTLAHEFQHLINFNQHCIARRCSAQEATWINEGLSMVAEEIGGFGWNSARGRRSGAAYLDRLPITSPNRSYDTMSLTLWEGDPIGNYEAVHSFFRYYADRFGTPVLGNLERDRLGEENLQLGLGMEFPRLVADWTTALVFSNESSSPVVGQFDYKGTGWTPFHTQLRYLNYEGLGSTPQTLTVREDGWRALLSGPGTGSAATVTVTSTELAKPTVVVIRFKGTLPRQ